MLRGFAMALSKSMVLAWISDQVTISAEMSKIK